MARKINTVAVYGRKSREDNESLESQLSALIEICEQNDWEYELFKEEGNASSQDFDRPELQKLLSLVEKYHFDAIVATELSRLSRNRGHAEEIQNILKEVDCLLVTPTRVYDYSKPEDEFVSDIMTVVAKQEYNTIKARLKRGIIQSAKKGNYLGKKVPVGYVYNRDTKKLQLSNDAPIVKRIFDDYVSGVSTKEIAYNFTFENVTTSTGMLWSPAGIARILGNPVYKGTSIYGKTTGKNGKRGIKTSIEEQIIVEDTHVPLVSKEEWELVQKIKAEKNSKPIALGANKRKFSGLIKCGLCGATHSFQTSKYKRKRIASCQTRHYSDDRSTYEVCGNKGMNIVEFEDYFYTFVSQYEKDLSKFIDLIKEAESTYKNKDGKSDILSLERQIKKIEQDIKRVQQGFIAQIFTEGQASEQIKNYNSQIAYIKKQIEDIRELENNSTVDHYSQILEKIRMFFNGRDTLPEKVANQLLCEFVEAIYYTRIDSDMVVDMNIVWKHQLNEELVND